MITKKSAMLIDKFTNLCKKEEGGDVITAALFFLVKVHKAYGVPLNDPKCAENLKNILCLLDGTYFEKKERNDCD